MLGSQGKRSLVNETIKARLSLYNANERTRESRWRGSVTRSHTMGIGHRVIVSWCPIFCCVAERLGERYPHTGIHNMNLYSTRCAYVRD